MATTTEPITKIITVRMTERLHELVKNRAHELNQPNVDEWSMNRYCVQAIQNELNRESEANTHG